MTARQIHDDEVTRIGKESWFTMLKGAGAGIAQALVNPGPDIPAEWILDPGYPLPKMSAARLSKVRSLQKAYQVAMERRFVRAQVKSPEQLVALLAPLMNGVEVEQAFVICMDSQARCINAPAIISRGDLDGTELGPRIVFRIALLAGAVQVAIAHNHPSTEVTPSAADRSATSVVARAGRIIGIPLVDHIVVGSGMTFTSLRRESPHLFNA